MSNDAKRWLLLAMLGVLLPVGADAQHYPTHLDYQELRAAILGDGDVDAVMKRVPVALRTAPIRRTRLMLEENLSLPFPIPPMRKPAEEMTGAEKRDFIVSLACTAQPRLDPALLLAQMTWESGSPDIPCNARGQAGEIGPGQWLPVTWQELGLPPELITDCTANLAASSWYMAQLVNDNGEDDALRIYNSGGAYHSEAVNQYASSVQAQRREFGHVTCQP